MIDIASMLSFQGGVRVPRFTAAKSGVAGLTKALAIEWAVLADSLARRGLSLEPGQWISTGAITGVHPIDSEQRADARFDSSFLVSCSAVAYISADCEIRSET